MGGIVSVLHREILTTLLPQKFNCWIFLHGTSLENIYGVEGPSISVCESSSTIIDITGFALTFHQQLKSINLLNPSSALVDHNQVNQIFCELKLLLLNTKSRKDRMKKKKE